MKTASDWIKGWRMKRNFVRLVKSKEPRLLRDAGFTPDVVYQKLRTPFWKF